MKLFQIDIVFNDLIWEVVVHFVELLTTTVYTYSS